MSITAIFVAIFAVFHMAAAMRVGVYRNETDIRYGDGGDQVLMRRIRAHGNFIENVPMALLAMGSAEYVGVGSTFLVVGGLALLLGRILHYFMTIGVGWGWMRTVSMLLNFVPFVLFPALILASQFDDLRDQVYLLSPNQPVEKEFSQTLMPHKKRV